MSVYRGGEPPRELPDDWVGEARPTTRISRKTWGDYLSEQAVLKAELDALREVAALAQHRRTLIARLAYVHHPYPTPADFATLRVREYEALARLDAARKVDR